MQRLRRVWSSHLLLGFYLACMLLVFSFILFEVLDIDGSDFPVASPVRAIRNTTSAEEMHDLRRSLLHAHADVALDLYHGLAIQGLGVTPTRLAPHAPTVTAPRFAKTCAVTLPRSSIDVAAG